MIYNGYSVEKHYDHFLLGEIKLQMLKWRDITFREGDVFIVELFTRLKGDYGYADYTKGFYCNLELNHRKIALKDYINNTKIFEVDLDEVDLKWDKEKTIQEWVSNGELDEMLELWEDEFSLEHGFTNEVVVGETFEDIFYFGNKIDNPSLDELILQYIEEDEIEEDEAELFLEMAEKVGYKGDRKSWF